MRKRIKPPIWWDDADGWMTVGDTLCAVGPWLLTVMVLAMVVSAL